MNYVKLTSKSNINPNERNFCAHETTFGVAVFLMGTIVIFRILVYVAHIYDRRKKITLNKKIQARNEEVEEK